MTDELPPEEIDWGNPPSGLKYAATWKLVADIVSRHLPLRDLRVYELHPAGGMGDTLSLREMNEASAYGVQRNDFRGWQRLGDSESGSRANALGLDRSYVRAVLQETTYAETLRAVLTSLGLDQGVPLHGALIRPRALAYQWMARMLWCRRTDTAGYQWRSAILDTSGYGGTGPRSAFADDTTGFQHIRASLREPDSAQPHPLYDVWFLTTEAAPNNPARSDIQIAIDAATATLWLNTDPPVTHDAPSTECNFLLQEGIEEYGSMDGLSLHMWSLTDP